MDTPTRERIEALEARVKELERWWMMAEKELADLRAVAGAVSSGPDFHDVVIKLPPLAEEQQ